MPTEAALFDFTNALQPARRAWLQAVSQVLAGTGVSPSLASAVLLTFRMGLEVNQRMLADELGVNAAALVRILDAGESAGLLTRRLGKDRRKRLIDLSTEGRHLAEGVERTLAELRAELLGDLTAADVATASRVLRHLEGRARDWAKDGAHIVTSA